MKDTRATNWGGEETEREYLELDGTNKQRKKVVTQKKKRQCEGNLQ